MARHPIDIILILLRARLGQEAGPLTQADKSRLMDVIQTAGQHGVGPALHGGLKVMMDRGKADGWNTVAPMLKILEEQNAARNRQVRALCLHMNTILRSANITPVFLKGCGFIVEDEQAAPWRFVSDVDVLIDETALENAASVLQESGLELAGSPDQYRSARHHHYAPLFDRQSGMSVELHRRLLRDAALDNQLMDYSSAQRMESKDTDHAVTLLSPAERLNHVIWHAQVGNLNEALHQINLRDMLDASLLMSASDIALEQLGARADKAGLQQSFNNFLAAHDELMRATTTSSQQSAWLRTAMQRLTKPPSQNTRTLELGLHYLKTGISNPSRLINGLRAMIAQGPMGHAKRILGRRTGSSKN
jgi:hypothetical protein